jgi:hypothetical protein
MAKYKLVYFHLLLIYCLKEYNKKVSSCSNIKSVLFKLHYFNLFVVYNVIFIFALSNDVYVKWLFSSIVVYVFWTSLLAPSFSCCSIKRLQCCSMLWRPIRFSRKNDVQFVFNLIFVFDGGHNLFVSIYEKCYIRVAVRRWVTLVEQELLSLLKHILGFYRSCLAFWSTSLVFTGVA